MTNNICAVVCTFNRSELLKGNIRALRNQSVKLDQIIVINNGSTDDTQLWLDQQSDLIVLKEESNIGASAAYSKVIKYGYDLGFRWIWMMDDDAFPSIDCLKNLIASDHFSDDLDVALAPLVIEGAEIAHAHRGTIDLNQPKAVMQQKVPNSFYSSINKEYEISFISFVGMIVGRNVVAKAGLPNDKFFIFNDDLEWSIRIIHNGFKMFLIKEAVMLHRFDIEYNEKDVKQLLNNSDKIYARKSLVQKIKGRIEFLKLINDLSTRSIYFALGKRNIIYTLIQYHGLTYKFYVFLLKDIFESVYRLIATGSNRTKMLKLFYHAYKQGLTGKFDTPKLLSFKS
jgi:rhamnopyranosyl-N-acetylglucosaminyl-diphospho-decaprenol beta-1,3/1,4-galactofuranosyltransferase